MKSIKSPNLNTLKKCVFWFWWPNVIMRSPRVTLLRFISVMIKFLTAITIKEKSWLGNIQLEWKIIKVKEFSGTIHTKRKGQKEELLEGTSFIWTQNHWLFIKTWIVERKEVLVTAGKQRTLHWHYQCSYRSTLRSCNCSVLYRIVFYLLVVLYDFNFIYA